MPFGELTVQAMAADGSRRHLVRRARASRAAGTSTRAGGSHPCSAAIGRPTDVEVAPDGAAWFATGRCTLARAAADGSVTLHPVPIPASRLAFDPTGVWLASPARLVHTTLDAPPGACDDTPPAVRVRPAVRRPDQPVRRCAAASTVRLAEAAALQVARILSAPTNWWPT